MVKIIKLKETYFDSQDVEMDIFMVSFSDIPYLKYGDIILDYITCNTTSDRIEEYINDENLDSDVLESKIKEFSYKQHEVENSRAYNFLKEIWRDIKLKELMG